MDYKNVVTAHFVLGEIIAGDSVMGYEYNCNILDAALALEKYFDEKGIVVNYIKESHQLVLKYFKGWDIIAEGKLKTEGGNIIATLRYL